MPALTRCQPLSSSVRLIKMTAKIFQHPSLYEVRYIDESGGCEKPHTHASMIVAAVSGGHISLQINEAEVRLKKGVVAIVGPNMLHCIRSYSSDFKGIYILDIFDLPPFCNRFNSTHFQMFKSQILNNIQFYNRFLTLCQKLLSSLEDSEKTELLSEWVNIIHSEHYSSYAGNPRKHLELADKIRQILDEHGEETPPFDEISVICGLSKERCNRIFRSAYNISIQGYFLNKKAAHARVLLSSSLPLADIALECGFYDQSHFSRVFKEIFQISPAKYRTLVGEARQSHTR